MSVINIWDFILLPIYLLVIYSLAYAIRNHFYKTEHPLRKYFIPGLSAKIAGAIFIGLVYHYYYKGGDTFDSLSQIAMANIPLSQAKHLLPYLAKLSTSTSESDVVLVSILYFAATSLKLYTSPLKTIT